MTQKRHAAAQRDSSFRTVAFHCYRPGAVALSPFDAALLQLFRNERFKRAGLTVRDLTYRVRAAAHALIPTSSIRRGLARLKRAGLVERHAVENRTPYLWQEARRG
jgi:hypothetical protein